MWNILFKVVVIVVVVVGVVTVIETNIFLPPAQIYSKYLKEIFCAYPSGRNTYYVHIDTCVYVCMHAYIHAHFMNTKLCQNECRCGKVREHTKYTKHEKYAELLQYKIL
jgi:hypothetical protein